MASKKDPASRRLIEGLALIDPATLDPAFRRFRNDDLYYISSCKFEATDPTQRAQFIANLKPGQILASHNPTVRTQQSASLKGGQVLIDMDQQFVARCVALTPVAFFITDQNGKMDRATRFEALRGMTYQHFLKSSLFSTERRLQIVLKINKEPDCFFYIDNSHGLGNQFIQTLDKIMAVRKESRHPYDVKEISCNEDIESYISSELPRGYLSPQQIIKLNKDRQAVLDNIESVTAEIAAIKKDVAVLTPLVQERREELALLEGKASGKGNMTELRQQREELHTQYVSLHKTHTVTEININKMKQDNERLQEQLQEERLNYNSLVEKNIAQSDDAKTREQQEMTALRQKAQKRECDKLTARLHELQAQLKAKPTYSGHDVFAAKAAALEDQVTAAVDKWGKEMDAASKMEKFLDHMVADIERHNRLMAKLHREKIELMDAIQGPPPPEEKKPEPPAAAPAGGDEVTLDDDLLGGGGDAAPTAAPPTASPTGDDDLLGGGDEKPAAAAAADAAAAPADAPAKAPEGSPDLLADDAPAAPPAGDVEI